MQPPDARHWVNFSISAHASPSYRESSDVLRERYCLRAALERRAIFVRSRACKEFSDPQTCGAAPCQVHPNGRACAGSAAVRQRVLLSSKILLGSVQSWTCHILQTGVCPLLI